MHRALGGGRVVVELVDDAALALVDALDRHLLRLRGGGEAARVAHQGAEGGRALELEDGGVVDAAGDRGQGADRRDVDHVAGQELGVLRFVAREQEVVQVQVGDDLAVALELDRAHRAGGGGAAGGEDRVHQGAERAHGVGAGALGVADHEHLHRAQLAHGDQQVEVAEVARHRGLHELRDVLVRDAGHRDRAHARDVDHAVAVDHRAVVDVDLAPGADQELVARADHVVGRDRDVLHRGERGGCALEQVVAEQRQALAGGVVDEGLELVLLGRGGCERRLGRGGDSRLYGRDLEHGRHRGWVGDDRSAKRRRLRILLLRAGRHPVAVRAGGDLRGGVAHREAENQQGLKQSSRQPHVASLSSGDAASWLLRTRTRAAAAVDSSLTENRGQTPKGKTRKNRGLSPSLPI